MRKHPVSWTLFVKCGHMAKWTNDFETSSWLADKICPSIAPSILQSTQAGSAGGDNVSFAERLSAKSAQLAPSRFTVFVFAPAAKKRDTGVKYCRFKWCIYYVLTLLTTAHPPVPHCLNKLPSACVAPCPCNMDKWLHCWACRTHRPPLLQPSQVIER